MPISAGDDSATTCVLGCWGPVVSMVVRGAGLAPGPSRTRPEPDSAEYGV